MFGRVEMRTSRQLVPRRIRRGAQALLGLLLAFPGDLSAQAQIVISGWVRTARGDGVGHVAIRVRSAGGISTSDSGEFRIGLPGGFQVGDQIVLDIGDKQWIITHPWEGRTWVPRTGLIEVVVARKGDVGLLADPKLVTEIVRVVTAELLPARAAAPGRDEFLARKAGELGFTLEQLKVAIAKWSENVQGPYQKGLAALYERRYTEASAYVRASIASAEGDLVEKYISLGSGVLPSLCGRT